MAEDRDGVAGRDLQRVGKPLSAAVVDEHVGRLALASQVLRVGDGECLAAVLFAFAEL